MHAIELQEVVTWQQNERHISLKLGLISWIFMWITMWNAIGHTQRITMRDEKEIPNSQ
jgi:hypothetical protein